MTMRMTENIIKEALSFYVNDEQLSDVECAEIAIRKAVEKTVYLYEDRFIEYLYIKCSEGEIEVRNMEHLIDDLKTKMEE